MDNDSRHPVTLWWSETATEPWEEQGDFPSSRLASDYVQEQSPGGIYKTLPAGSKPS